MIRKIAPEPAPGAVDAHVLPLDVNTFPLVEGATTCTAEVPLPRTTLLAVSAVAPVPPLATGSVPVTPVAKGKPVTLVITPEAGVPKAGATSVLLVIVVVLVAVTTFVGVIISDKLAIFYTSISVGQVIVSGKPTCSGSCRRSPRYSNTFKGTD